AEQRRVIAIIREILGTEQPVKVIICIREEFLACLRDFEKEVPQLFRKRLRMEAMNFVKKKRVINGLAAHRQTNLALESGEEEVVATEIFDRVRGDEQAGSIQLPYLQV